MKTRMLKQEAQLKKNLSTLEKGEVDLDTLFHFRAGDKVLRCRKVVSKLDSRAEGPFVVLGVTGLF